MTEMLAGARPGGMVARLTGRRGRPTGPNPRKEADENDLAVENQRLLSLGLDPITLEEGLLRRSTETRAGVRRPGGPHQDTLPEPVVAGAGERARPVGER